MPARAISTRRVPARLRVGDGFTAQNRRGFSYRCHLNARTGQHIVLRAPRQAAIFAVFRHIKQHMTFWLISVIVAIRPLIMAHFAHMAGGERLNIGRQNADLGNIFKVFFVKTAEISEISTLFGRFGVNFIVNVGNIARVDHLRVAAHSRTSTSNTTAGRKLPMARAVNRWPAYINRHAGRVLRHKNLFCRDWLLCKTSWLPCAHNTAAPQSQQALCRFLV